MYAYYFYQTTKYEMVQKITTIYNSDYNKNSFFFYLEPNKFLPGTNKFLPGTNKFLPGTNKNQIYGRENGSNC